MQFGHRTKSNAMRFYEFNAESSRTKSNYDTKLNGEKASQLWESNTPGKFKECWNQKGRVYNEIIKFINLPLLYELFLSS